MPLEFSPSRQMLRAVRLKLGSVPKIIHLPGDETYFTEDDPSREGEHPVIYHPGHDTIYVGDQNTHHADLYDKIRTQESSIVPWVDPYEMTSDQLGAGGEADRLGLRYALISSNKGLNTWGGDWDPEHTRALYEHGYLDQPDGSIHHDWNLSKITHVHSSIRWTPGNEGRGLISPEGNLHAWNNGYPFPGRDDHFSYMLHDLGIEPSQALNWGYAYITPEGQVQGAGATKKDVAALQRQIRQQTQNQNQWEFTSAYPNVVELSGNGEWARKNGLEIGQPIVHHIPSNTTYIGPPGHYHVDMAADYPKLFPHANVEDQWNYEFPNSAYGRLHQNNIEWYGYTPENYKDIAERLGNWTFDAKVGSSYPEVKEEDYSSGPQSWLPDRRPIIYHEGNNTIYVGPHGAHHDGLLKAIDRDYSEWDPDNTHMGLLLGQTSPIVHWYDNEYHEMPPLVNQVLKDQYGADSEDRWNLSKIANEIVPQVSQASPTPEDILGDRIPILWYPNPQDPRYDDTVFSGGRPEATPEHLIIGQQGQTHRQLEREFWNQGLGRHPLAPEKGVIDLPGHNFRWFNYSQSPVASHDRVVQALRGYFPNLQTEEDNQWNFSKVADIWSPEEGRWISDFIPEINVKTVDDPGTAEDEGEDFHIRRPLHFDAETNTVYVGGIGQYHDESAKSHGIDPRNMTRGAWLPQGSEVWNEPPGSVQWFSHQIRPEWEEAIAKKLNGENGEAPKNPWALSKVAWTEPDRTQPPEIIEVPEDQIKNPGKGEYGQEDWLYKRQPFVYYPEDHQVIVGPRGTYHSQIAPNIHLNKNTGIGGILHEEGGWGQPKVRNMGGVPDDVIHAIADKYGIAAETSDQWNLAKVAATPTIQNGNHHIENYLDMYGPMITRPWQLGEHGKGMFLDNTLHLWSVGHPTNDVMNDNDDHFPDPHHDGIFDYARGKNQNGESAMYTHYQDYVDTPKLHINPDGTMETLWRPMASEIKNSLAQLHPDLKPDSDAWNLSKLGTIWDEKPQADISISPEYQQWVNRVLQQGYAGGKGKYIRTRDGRLIQWNTSPEGDDPHHFEVLKALGIPDNQIYSDDPYDDSGYEGYLPAGETEPDWRFGVSQEDSPYAWQPNQKAKGIIDWKNDLVWGDPNLGHFDIRLQNNIPIDRRNVPFQIDPNGEAFVYGSDLDDRDRGIQRNKEAIRILNQYHPDIRSHYDYLNDPKDYPNQWSLTNDPNWNLSKAATQNGEVIVPSEAAPYTGGRGKALWDRANNRLYEWSDNPEDPDIHHYELHNDNNWSWDPPSHEQIEHYNIGNGYLESWRNSNPEELNQAFPGRYKGVTGYGFKKDWEGNEINDNPWNLSKMANVYETERGIKFHDGTEKWYPAGPGNTHVEIMQREEIHPDQVTDYGRRYSDGDMEWLKQYYGNFWEREYERQQQNKWNLSRVSADKPFPVPTGKQMYEGYGDWEPWEFGHEGKGFYDPSSGKVTAWKTVSLKRRDGNLDFPGPYHQPAGVPEGTEANNLRPFWIAPDGTLSDHGYGTSSLEPLLDYHPDLKIYDNDGGWRLNFGQHWGKISSDYPLRDKKILKLLKQGWHRGNYGKGVLTDDDQLIHWPTDDDGDPHHQHVLDAITDDPRNVRAFVYFNPDGSFYSENMSSDQYRPDQDQKIMALHPEVTEPEGNIWNFDAKTHKRISSHLLDWDEGNEGKGVLLKDGTFHTWNVDDVRMPNHVAYLKEHNIPLEEGQGFFEINPQGRLYHADAYNPEAKAQVAEAAKLDPRLVPAEGSHWDIRSNFDIMIPNHRWKI